MKKNMGNADRIIRLAIALLLMYLNITESLNGTISIVMWVVSVVFLITSLLAYCPLYSLIGISTCSKVKS